MTKGGALPTGITGASPVMTKHWWYQLFSQPHLG